MSVRIGLVGAGPWARQTHAPALAAHPGVDFVGGWARDPQAAAEVFPHAFDSPAALFAAVDAVAFAVPPNVQAPLAAEAARAGKHVILDKPIALDVDAATAVADAVAQAGVRSIVAFTRRFAPETRDFLARAAELSPIAAEAQWLSGAALSGRFAASAWRQEEGALLDVGPHVLDLLDAVAGPVEGVDAARYDAASDTWTIQLAHADGAASSASLSLRTPVMPTIVRVAAHSGKGLAVLENRDTPATECFRVLLDEFLAAIASGSDHPLDARHGLHIQRLIARIREAASVPGTSTAEPVDAEIVDAEPDAPAAPSYQPPAPYPPAAPSYEDVTGYTAAGVPTFDHVRQTIERRTTTALGAEELAHGTTAGQDAERAFAEREKAAKAKLEEIRRSMRP